MGLSLPNPFKAAKKIVKKVAKPFRKISKFLPKEARPFMPFLSAAMPFMLPAKFAMMGMNPALSRGIMSSLANIGGQAMADPEGEDINLLSTLMAGGTGALGAEGMGDRLRLGINKGIPPEAAMARGPAELGMTTRPIGFWQGAENLGREGLATAADYLSGSAEGIASLGKNPASLFDAGVKGARFPGVTSLAKAAAVPLTQATGDMAKSLADQQWRAFDEAEAADLAEWEKGSMIDDQRNADLTMKYYRAAGHDEETIKTAMDLNDIGHLYEPPVEEQESAADGGRVGLREGGTSGVLAQILPQAHQPQAITTWGGQNGPMFNPFAPTVGSGLGGQRPVFPRLTELEQGVGRAEGSLNRIRKRLGNDPYQQLGLQPHYGRPIEGLQQPLLSLGILQSSLRGGLQQESNPDLQSLREGGIAGLKDGGMLNFGGREMDLRTGGFVPIGRQERADDVPARLSKNEFVMTADAVRAAGGGSVNKGAQRMYDIMNKLEARA